MMLKFRGKGRQNETSKNIRERRVDLESYSKSILCCGLRNDRLSADAKRDQHWNKQEPSLKS